MAAALKEKGYVYQWFDTTERHARWARWQHDISRGAELVVERLEVPLAAC